MQRMKEVYNRVVGPRVDRYNPPVSSDSCPICGGSGYVTHERRYNQPGFGVTYTCECQFPALVETLEGFNIGQNHDLQLALEAVTNWLDGEGPPMLTLAGPPGVGKTHLMLAARNHCILTRQSHMFLTDRALDARIRQSFDNKDTDQVLRNLGNGPRLMIDDFGIVARADTMLGFMDDLIRTREIAAGEGVQTLITTNLGSDELPARIRSRLNDRVRSRYLVIDAPDYRLKVREA